MHIPKQNRKVTTIMYMDFDTVQSNDRVCGSIGRKTSCGKTDGCSCNSNNMCNSNNGGAWGLTGYPLASVYSPLQCFEDLYEIDVALNRGTVFVGLDLPFMGESVAKGGNCCG